MVVRAHDAAESNDFLLRHRTVVIASRDTRACQPPRLLIDGPWSPECSAGLEARPIGPARTVQLADTALAFGVRWQRVPAALSWLAEPSASSVGPPVWGPACANRRRAGTAVLRAGRGAAVWVHPRPEGIGLAGIRTLAANTLVMRAVCLRRVTAAAGLAAGTERVRMDAEALAGAETRIVEAMADMAAL